MPEARKIIDEIILFYFFGNRLAKGRRHIQNRFFNVVQHTLQDCDHRSGNATAVSAVASQSKVLSVHNGTRESSAIGELFFHDGESITSPLIPLISSKRRLFPFCKPFTMLPTAHHIIFIWRSSFYSFSAKMMDSIKMCIKLWVDYRWWCGVISE